MSAALIKIILAVTLSLFFLSCKKDTKIETPVTTTPVDKPASLAFRFEALVNNKTLVPATVGYTNTSKDNFTIAKFNYYISNISFKREDGVIFKEPESYHLIQHVEGKTTFTVTGLPEGN